jgi:asparagine synthase (glutamine-hydrolysing)
MKEFDQTLKGAIESLEISETNILLNLQHYKKLLEFGGSGQENTTSYDILAPEFVNVYQDVTQSPAYPTTPGHSKNYFYAYLRMHLLCRDIPYILRMEDRNSMAKSIETRVPFLDHRFIEFVFSHDYKEFMRKGMNKSMLRRSMGKYLPQEVIQRKSKSPRPGNNSHLIYHVLYKEMIALLGTKLFKELGYFKADTINYFQNDCLVKNKSRAIVWFRIYILLRWFSLKTQ